MAEQWNDIYFRARQDDTGMYPMEGCLSGCFDIITRQDPYKDPNKLITDDWDKNDSQSMYEQMNNYIYVRGTNKSGKEQTGTVSLFYSKASLLLYPQLWRKNKILLGNGSDKYNVKVAKDGHFVCADTEQGCFYWSPQAISNDHYCLISCVDTPDHPVDVKDINNITDFAVFIGQNRSFGWRNVSVVDSGVGMFSETVDYDEGEEAHEVHFILSCRGLPIGSEVAIDCPAAGANPPIHIERTKITSSVQDIGCYSNIPANFKGEITYYFWPNGGKPSEDFDIQLNCVYFVPQGNELLLPYARHPEELGFCLSDKMLEKMNINKSIGPQKAMILGQYKTITKQ